jgi:hypothetical protein
VTDQWELTESLLYGVRRRWLDPQLIRPIVQKEADLDSWWRSRWFERSSHGWRAWRAVDRYSRDASLDPHGPSDPGLKVVPATCCDLRDGVDHRRGAGRTHPDKDETDEQCQAKG